MILVVDDEQYIRSSLVGLLQDEGFEAEAVSSAERAEAALAKNDIELILLDIQMGGKDGITFLDDNVEALSDIPVIIISGQADIPTAVMAIKLGSYDFIEKPLSPERVLVTVRQALRLSRSLRAEKKLTGQILEKYKLIGESQVMKNLRGLIEKAALSDSTILITGENGTGKELIAHHIHYKSPRKAEPLVAVNCPAITESLFESELFGHIKGAFTGANANRKGRFAQAGDGTLFLDEIGDLPAPMQAKLLRVLESGEYEKVGSDVTEQSQCRIIAATNRDMPAAIEAGTFRQDLYYRVNVINIEAPALASRVEDIPLLVEHFLDESGAAGDFAFTSEAIGYLASCNWPGNVRQLKNIIQQVTFLCASGEIGADDIRRIRSQNRDMAIDASEGSGNRLAEAVRQFEVGYLSDLFRRHDGNIAAMARELNMDRGNLSKKLKSLKIV
ncbi:MAG: sigma-54 dependent transcriptional regulator [Candidatus Zixiibacteriota bacterium]